MTWELVVAIVVAGAVAGVAVAYFWKRKPGGG